MTEEQKLIAYFRANGGEFGLQGVRMGRTPVETAIEVMEALRLVIDHHSDVKKYCYARCII